MRPFFVFTLLAATLTAEPVAVHYTEGTLHGFLALRSTDGKILASGDLKQKVHGGEVTSHLVFRFKDGSLDDETSVFSQRGTFQLVSDHHIQKGPAFEKPYDLNIDVKKGTVNGQPVDLPNDLANGLIINLMKNIPTTSETSLSWVALTPKPRVVKLSINAEGDDSFSIAGIREKATRFRIKIKIGGIAGLIAPLIGKQPADIFVWIASGDVTAFVKSEGPQYLGGPVWRIELANPVWTN